MKVPGVLICDSVQVDPATRAATLRGVHFLRGVDSFPAEVSFTCYAVCCAVTEPMTLRYIASDMYGNALARSADAIIEPCLAAQNFAEINNVRVERRTMILVGLYAGATKIATGRVLVDLHSHLSSDDPR